MIGAVTPPPTRYTPPPTRPPPRPPRRATRVVQRPEIHFDKWRKHGDRVAVPIAGLEFPLLHGLDGLFIQTSPRPALHPDIGGLAAGSTSIYSSTVPHTWLCGPLPCSGLCLVEQDRGRDAAAHAVYAPGGRRRGGWRGMGTASGKLNEKLTCRVLPARFFS